MKVGDLVRCLFQPRWSSQNGACLPMPHIIKGELGVILKARNNESSRVAFPQLGYEHALSNSVLEVVSESR